MARLVVAVVVGFLAARLVWLAAREWFAQPAFTRPNYRGRQIPTATGIVLPVALFVVEAGRTLAASAGVGDDATLDGPRALVLVAVCGFGLLGAVDDLAGSGDYRGFKGHILALVSGRFTTGALKLLGGAAVALVVAGAANPRPSLGRVVADGALVALAANLGNLLDLAPGRALKGTVGAFVALGLATGADPALVGVAVVVGTGLGLWPEDVRERLMLGDSGANALGAALGLGMVMATSPVARNWALAAVVALNLVGETVSFSRVIQAVPPLRALDQAGRPRPPSGRSSG